MEIIDLTEAPAARFANTNMIVCGAVRNCGDRLGGSIATVEKIMRLTSASHAIIVTNDNDDSTLIELQKWQRNSRNISIVNIDGLACAYPNRIDRLAAVRNFYLREISANHKDPAIVCVCDLDGPNANLDVEAIPHAACALPRWDGIFSNQRQAYYDIYALRHPTWCPGDCWEEVRFVVGSHSRPREELNAIAFNAIAKLVYGRQYQIPAPLPPIPVLSAFGGLALYRRDALQDCWYGSRDKAGRVVCEHVVLNEQIIAKAGQLFIAPSLLNDAPTEHLGPNSGQAFPREMIETAVSGDVAGYAAA
jgi:hypothetical protein